MKLNFILMNNRLQALTPDGDLLGYVEFSEGKEGVYIKYSVVSEEFRGKGIGYQLYEKLIERCIEDNIKLFRMKNPTESALKVWKKFESRGVKFIDRSDLMSTNEEVEIDLSSFK